MPEEEMHMFAAATEKEANEKDWKRVIGFEEGSRDPQKFRMLESSIME